MENVKAFKTKYLLSLIFSLILSFSSFAGTLERQKEGMVEEPDDSNIIFLFSGDQAQHIISKLVKAETKIYKLPGGFLKVFIGTNIICLDRSPSIDEKSASCRMVINERGEAIDVRNAMKSFIESLDKLPLP